MKPDALYLSSATRSIYSVFLSRRVAARVFVRPVVRPAVRLSAAGEEGFYGDSLTSARGFFIFFPTACIFFERSLSGPSEPGVRAWCGAPSLR